MTFILGGRWSWQRQFLRQFKHRTGEGVRVASADLSAERNFEGHLLSKAYSHCANWVAEIGRCEIEAASLMMPKHASENLMGTGFA
jgi:hypothetical protein